MTVPFNIHGDELSPLIPGTSPGTPRQQLPAAYREKARAEVVSGPFRPHLALANGKLYARDNRKLVCWSFSGAEK